jgi:hypothetical protein
MMRRRVEKEDSQGRAKRLTHCRLRSSSAASASAGVVPKGKLMNEETSLSTTKSSHADVESLEMLLRLSHMSAILAPQGNPRDELSTGESSGVDEELQISYWSC